MWAKSLAKKGVLTVKQSEPQKKEPIKAEKSVESEVISSRYTKLETLLKSQDFREADIETARVMLAVANRRREGWLRKEDAENFPCKELRTIDNLWLKYSQGKFGISVQQEIYKNLGGTKLFDVNVWRSFGDRVGWRKDGSWLDDYSDFNFSLSAPTGHLPAVSRRAPGMIGWSSAPGSIWIGRDEVWIVGCLFLLFGLCFKFVFYGGGYCWLVGCWVGFGLCFGVGVVGVLVLRFVVLWWFWHSRLLKDMRDFSISLLSRHVECNP
ncbi:GUN4 domain-containing protein [Cylindrospermopsis raciborskii]|uniref:GUN4 domain-containing protein n=1 Tax=Cylindrospermopsis raciborskii TaxID=77022 RepID=UPI0002F9EE37|nr:GUN4 domain-containing protein [Cylindrospermopsis raciborskii]